MYLSLLVPLDRSSFAEQALPLVLSITRRAKARLELVEVHALDALEEVATARTPYEPERDAEYVLVTDRTPHRHRLPDLDARCGVPPRG